MPLFYTDFSDATVGASLPPGWTVELAGGSTSVVAGGISGRALRIAHGTVGAYHILNWSAVGTVDSAEPVCCRFLIEQTTNQSLTSGYSGPAVRQTGGGGLSSGVRALAASRGGLASQVLRRVFVVGDTRTYTNVSAASEYLTALVWMSAYCNGETFFAEMHRADTLEYIAGSSASTPAANKVSAGVGHWAFSPNAVSVIHAVSVGTGADAAATPFGATNERQRSRLILTPW